MKNIRAEKIKIPFYFLRINFLLILLLLMLSSQTQVSAGDQKGNGTDRSVLDTLLSRVHRPRSQIDLSRFSDDHEMVVCRIPLVEDLLANPFYMPAFIQVYGAYFKGSRDAVSPSSELRRALEMASINLDDVKPPRQRQRSLMDVFEDMEVRFRHAPMSPGTRKSLSKQIENLPEGLAEVMSILCEAFMAAAELRRDALKHITTEERHKIIDNPLAFFLSESDPNQLSILGHPSETQFELIEIARKVDLRKLFLAEKILAEAVETTRPKLQWIHKRTIAVKNDEILLEFMSPLGPIIVGGPGINRYDRDAALLVDLDGSDIYNNNAGGNFPVRGGVACLIDMGGNDIYVDHRTGVQGAGILGVGILVDYHGEDTYIGGDWCQGAGYLGAGLFYDEKGSDNHQAGILSQGAGAFGLGINIDVDGHDNFSCDSLSQGFGGTMGLGILVNVYGRDNYAAGKADSKFPSRTSGISQGAGAGFQSRNRLTDLNIFGGLGFLVDAHGNDTYFGPEFCQGAGLGFAAGAILDAEGDDLYDVRRCGQGCGTTYATGLLVDQSGEDHYYGGSTVQGAAIDHAAGILLDYKGNDIYRQHGREALGYARGSDSFGLMIDYLGDDRYECGQDVQGAVLPPAEPIHWPTGVFLDHHGKDIYRLTNPISENHRNNAGWKTCDGEIGYDTEEDATVYFARQRGRSRMLQYQMSPVEGLEPMTGESSLGAQDPFRRFHALYNLIHGNAEILPLIVRSMDLGHPEYRRLLEEGMSLILYRSKWKKSNLATIKPLCDSIDPETRQWCLEMFARGRFTDGLPDIRRLLNDPEPDVRRTAAWLTGLFEDADARKELCSMVEHDTDPGCRRQAIKALLKLPAPDKCSVTFREALRDPEVSVVTAAAEAVGLIRDRRSVGILQLLASNGNIYLHRAAGKALIRIGDKSGFPVLIDTLSYPCEDHSSQHQITTLVDFLASFAGVHFGFDQSAWKDWWSRSEMDLNLEKNIEARRAYLKIVKKADKMMPSSLAQALERLRRTFPDYAGYDRALADIVCDRAHTLLKQKPTLALRLARLAYNMNPDLSRRIVLINALAASGDTDGALEHINIALENNPSNETLRQLRNQLMKRSQAHR